MPEFLVMTYYIYGIQIMPFKSDFRMFSIFLTCTHLHDYKVTGWRGKSWTTGIKTFIEIYTSKDTKNVNPHCKHQMPLKPILPCKSRGGVITVVT